MNFSTETHFNLKAEDFFVYNRKSLSLEISTFKGFRYSKESIAIVNKLEAFIDNDIRLAGESLKVYVKENDDFFKVIKRQKKKTVFYTYLNNPMSMIRLLIDDSPYETNLIYFLIWDGLDSDMSSKIEILAKEFPMMPQFFVYNMFTDQVYDKSFYKRVLSIYW